jgi:nucleoside-diphosphate-sugar epimerase
MEVLVTGGAGYIGSTLVPMLLTAGHRVRVIDRLDHGGEALLGSWSHPQFELRHADIRDEAAVRNAVGGMDAVVHLAAIVGDPACARQPENAIAVNGTASKFLIDASRKAGVQRFIFASTCSNYGRMPDTNTYADETTELRPVSLYAETKVAIEKTLLASGNANGWCATPLRFATVFGVSPRMRFDLTVNEFTAELLTKKHLVVFGEQFWRPYVHVRDAACAIQLVLNSDRKLVAGKVFNLGDTEQNYQKQTLVELIKPLAPDARIEFVHKKEDPRDYRVSFKLIKDTLGFSITRTVPQGIQEVDQLVRLGVIQDLSDKKYRN